MAVQAEGESRPPPPPVVNIPAPPAPPDNPQNEEERRQVDRYEQWLRQQESAINEQLNYYEKEITKLRKQRKSLNSKQRTLRKNGNELSANDAADLERVSSECLGLQKSLESIRKQSRQHNMLKTDHIQKKQKAMEGQQPAGMMAGGVRPMGPGGAAVPGAGAGPGGWQGGNVPPGMVHVQRSPGPGGPAMIGAVQRMPGQQQGVQGAQGPGVQVPQHVMQQRFAMQQQQQQMMGGGGMRPGLTIQNGSVIQVQHGGGQQMRMMSPQTGSPSSQSPVHMSGQPSPGSLPHVQRQGSLQSSSSVSSSAGASSPSSSSRTSPSPSDSPDVGLNLNMTAKEMRERLGSQKRRDPRKDSNRHDMRRKFEMIQAL